MKLYGRKVEEVSPLKSITWAASFAIQEAVSAGVFTRTQADALVDRMNEIMGWLFRGQIVVYNEQTKLFEPHSPTGLTPEPGDETPDVLVIKGESA